VVLSLSDNRVTIPVSCTRPRTIIYSCRWCTHHRGC